MQELRKAFAPVFKEAGAKKAILFGSYARGTADEDSDVDLAIIAETNKPFLERFRDFRQLWQVSPVAALEVLVYTPEEFRQMEARGNPFIAEVLASGVVIYEARAEGRS